MLIISDGLASIETSAVVLLVKLKKSFENLDITSQIFIWKIYKNVITKHKENYLNMMRALPEHINYIIPLINKTPPIKTGLSTQSKEIYKEIYDKISEELCDWDPLDQTQITTHVKQFIDIELIIKNNSNALFNEKWVSDNEKLMCTINKTEQYSINKPSLNNHSLNKPSLNNPISHINADRVIKSSGLAFDEETCINIKYDNCDICLEFYKYVKIYNTFSERIKFIITEIYKYCVNNFETHVKLVQMLIDPNPEKIYNDSNTIISSHYINKLKYYDQFNLIGYDEEIVYHVEREDKKYIPERNDPKRYYLERYDLERYDFEISKKIPFRIMKYKILKHDVHDVHGVHHVHDVLENIGSIMSNETLSNIKYKYAYVDHYNIKAQLEGSIFIGKYIIKHTVNPVSYNKNIEYNTFSKVVPIIIEMLTFFKKIKNLNLTNKLLNHNKYGEQIKFIKSTESFGFEIKSYSLCIKWYKIKFNESEYILLCSPNSRIPAQKINVLSTDDDYPIPKNSDTKSS